MVWDVKLGILVAQKLVKHMIHLIKHRQFRYKESGCKLILRLDYSTVLFDIPLKSLIGHPDDYYLTCVPQLLSLKCVLNFIPKLQLDWSEVELVNLRGEGSYRFGSGLPKEVSLGWINFWHLWSLGVAYETATVHLAHAGLLNLIFVDRK